MREIPPRYAAVVLRDMSEPFLALDPRGIVIAVNQSMVDLLGVPEERLCDSHIDSVLLGLTRPDHLATATERPDIVARATGDDVGAQPYFLRVGSDVSLVSVRASAVADVHGSGVACVLFIVRDAAAPPVDFGRRAIDRAILEQRRSEAEERGLAEQDLRDSVAARRLVVHFQPVVDTRTGRVVGFEALVRLNHPVLGLLSAAEFLTVAEQSDVIADIGAAVIEDAVREAVAWGTDIDGPWVSVNVSPRQLGGGRLTSLVRHLLEDYRLPATRLVLEVTEQAFMVDRDAIDDLVAVDRLGVRLALDDFGTGQSRLTHLHDLPLSIVKIDGEFVSGLGRDPSASALVRSIVTLGRSLGLMTVAEGVETGEQLDVLRHIGCDFAQGWLWSPAIAEPQALITGPDEPPPYAGLEVVLPR